MSNPIRVHLDHTLGKEEVSRRMHAQSDEIASYFPAGFAEVETSWPDEDRMDMAVQAMGQTIRGHVEVYADEVVIELALPAMLSFLRGTIEGAVRKNGTKLLR